MEAQKAQTPAGNRGCASHNNSVKTMIHPIIHYDAKESPYIPLRKDLVRVCGGDGRTALVLALVEFWTNSYIKRNPDCVDLPWFRETIQDFVDGLFGTMTAKTIRKKLGWLIDSGLLVVRGSGTFQDRAKEYQINLSLLKQKLGCTEGKTTVCDSVKIPNGYEQRIVDTNGKNTNCETVKIPNGDEQAISHTEGKTTKCTNGKSTESHLVKVPNDPYISNNQNINNQSRTDFSESQPGKKDSLGSNNTRSRQPKNNSSLASETSGQGSSSASHTHSDFGLDNQMFEPTEVSFSDPEAYDICRRPNKPQYKPFLEFVFKGLDDIPYYQKLSRPLVFIDALKYFSKRSFDEKMMLIQQWREVKAIEDRRKAEWELIKDEAQRDTGGMTYAEVYGKREKPLPYRKPRPLAERAAEAKAKRDAEIERMAAILANG